jgi:alanine racemase
MERPVRALRLEIDIDAIRSNARAVMQAIGPEVRLFACLKGDAYGCGIKCVAPALRSAGVSHFAVGSIDDAVAIRQAGIDSEILLYPNCLPDAAATIESYDLTITINSIEEAVGWNSAASRPLPTFIKVDVGALRGGVMPHSASCLADSMRRLDKLRVVGAYAHLHLPDPVNMKSHALHQLGHFSSVVQQIETAGLKLRTRMVSGTAALLQFPEMDLDAVDPGRALFGLGFSGTTRLLPLRSAIRRWCSRLLLVKDVSPEDVAPYPAPFALDAPRKIGVAPFGWGDGMPRRLHPDARVLVRGMRVPLLPPGHFEHMRLDLTGVPDACYGDEVVILGRQGGASITLSEVAAWAGKDEMHFLGTLPRHIERVPVDD